MKKKGQGISYDRVRRLGLALPHVEEGTSYGTPALKVKGKLFVRLREEGDVIVLRMPFDLREGLLADDPGTYFITDHYLEYPWILVRLAKVTEPALRELLALAHASAIGAAARRKPPFSRA
ncbi:MAG TPA: MmcQ/YjbR family DNA-binding protein [Verrucomicrobiae bacterium]|nr:MmcQ/YjbR family DNA-binding protein [Verrucomicrobiae bacterium]